MIRCEVDKEDGVYRRLSCIGHAGFAESGQDIVCAAVSILVINTANSIEAFCGQDHTVSTNAKTGLIELRLNPPVNAKTALLMDSFVLGMTGISNQYGSSYITFTVKEVSRC
ncbi:MAG: ribosomal-processing cysteine protease Prp [Lachnospiraceae bacterium]|nr:ribosomal-processing cysteine protease Prp [Lachnospiraceae bacterium]